MLNKKNINDLSSYGIDVVSQIESLLADELSKEIDKEILKNLGIHPDRWERRKKSINKIFKSSE